MIKIANNKYEDKESDYFNFNDSITTNFFIGIKNAKMMLW